jgi:indolepyruvate decarboxylase
MSAQCLSTQTRFGLNPIIFVIDNGVYGVEQWLADASVFSNDNISDNTTTNTEGNTIDKSKDKQFYKSCILHRWKYSRLAEVFGCQGWEVHTYAELNAAMKGALANKTSPSIIQVVVPGRLIPDNAAWKIKVDSQPR